AAAVKGAARRLPVEVIPTVGEQPAEVRRGGDETDSDCEHDSKEPATRPAAAVSFGESGRRQDPCSGGRAQPAMGVEQAGRADAVAGGGVAPAEGRGGNDRDR